MEVLKRIDKMADERGLSFIVVGGAALIAWGISRQTCDLDLLVQEDERQQWKGMLQELGYHARHEQKTFVQYGPPTGGGWPLDLLVVALPTFSKIKQACVFATLGGVS